MSIALAESTLSCYPSKESAKQIREIEFLAGREQQSLSPT